MLFHEIAFEREYFLFKMPEQELVLPHEINVNIPKDECGYLAEARGTKARAIDEAWYHLLYEEYRVRKMLPENILLCENIAWWKMPKQQLYDLAREFGKNRQEDRSLYGNEIKAKTVQTAGLHIHFSNSFTDFGKRCEECGHQIERHFIGSVIDIPAIITPLDKAFAGEIKANKRQHGIYELKPWGFEYRSLPTNVDMKKVIEVLSEIRNK